MEREQRGEMEEMMENGGSEGNVLGGKDRRIDGRREANTQNLRIQKQKKVEG